MSITINKNDVALLRSVADYRMLTIVQASVLLSRNAAALRRRTKTLSTLEMLEELPVSVYQGRGHPQKAFGLGQRGFELLRQREILPETVEFEQARGTSVIPQASHQSLLNWCRIHLVHMTREIPRLSCEVYSGNSPFSLDPSHGTSLVCDWVPNVGGEREEEVRIRPDAVFIITDRDQRKSVLFFLEVDMGTEPIASSVRDKQDITSKIASYQTYFRSRRYKRYEQTRNVSLNGFRLLFVTSDPLRTQRLCRAVRSLPPSDFVWVTSRERIFSEGISGDIWFRGGKVETSMHSILGSLTNKMPIPGVSET